MGNNISVALMGTSDGFVMNVAGAPNYSMNERYCDLDRALATIFPKPGSHHDKPLYCLQRVVAHDGKKISHILSVYYPAYQMGSSRNGTFAGACIEIQQYEIPDNQVGLLLHVLEDLMVYQRKVFLVQDRYTKSLSGASVPLQFRSLSQLSLSGNGVKHSLAFNSDDKDSDMFVALLSDGTQEKVNCLQALLKHPFYLDYYRRVYFSAHPEIIESFVSPSRIIKMTFTTHIALQESQELDLKVNDALQNYYVKYNDLRSNFNKKLKELVQKKSEEKAKEFKDKYDIEVNKLQGKFYEKMAEERQSHNEQIQQLKQKSQAKTNQRPIPWMNTAQSTVKGSPSKRIIPDSSFQRVTQTPSKINILLFGLLAGLLSLICGIGYVIYGFFIFPNMVSEKVKNAEIFKAKYSITCDKGNHTLQELVNSKKMNDNIKNIKTCFENKVNEEFPPLSLMDKIFLNEQLITNYRDKSNIENLQFLGTEFEFHKLPKDDNNDGWNDLYQEAERKSVSERIKSLSSDVPRLKDKSRTINKDDKSLVTQYNSQVEQYNRETVELKERIERHKKNEVFDEKVSSGFLNSISELETLSPIDITPVDPVGEIMNHD